MVTRSAERVAYQRPAASTSASTSAVSRARTMAPSAPAAAQRSRAAAWIAHPFGVGDRFVAEPVALEPDEDELVLTLAPFGLERLEVERQVRVEVVVERRPAVADPAGEPGSVARLAADRRSAAAGPGPGYAVASSSGYNARGAASPDHRSTARGSSRPPPRGGGPARAPRGTRCRRRRAPGARRRSRSPGSAGPPLAIWSVPAIRARSAGWRFMTFATNGATVTRSGPTPRPSRGSSRTRRPGP